MKKAILCLLLCLLLLPTAVFADETPAPAQAEGAAGTSAPTAPAAPAESAPLAESAAPTATAAQEGTFAILHTGDTHGRAGAQRRLHRLPAAALPCGQHAQRL